MDKVHPQTIAVIRYTVTLVFLYFALKETGWATIVLFVLLFLGYEVAVSEFKKLKAEVQRLKNPYKL